MDWLSELDTRSVLIITAWGLFVALALPGLLFSYRGRLAKGLAHVAIWVGIAVALVTGYAYRDTFESIAARVTSELTPAGRPVETTGTDGERAVRIRRSSRGPFVARANVNGADVSMLVDTGASSVVLKSADAERAGIDLKALRFTIAVDTANGTSFCAPVRLRNIAVGGIAFQGVEALVAQPGNLKESLLGMNFLRRLRSYDFSGDFLTLRS
jgi:aspartyl protease family protein